MKQRRYMIWCDESVKKGRLFSNFYGGVLVDASNFEKIKDTLLDLKTQLLGTHELKWQKVNTFHLEPYKQLIQEFFKYVIAGNIKVRLMFTQNIYKPQGLSIYQSEHEYHLLYYQFLKHAFGLKFMEASVEEYIFLELFFDKLPDKKEKNDRFKQYIFELQNTVNFDKKNINIKRDAIMEIDSRDHILLQCLDVVMGAMAFRLNKHHLDKPEGKYHRGKRTRAKEDLYKVILNQICETRDNFNIGMSTGKDDGLRSLWLDQYRHWRFKPNNTVTEEYEED